MPEDTRSIHEKLSAGHYYAPMVRTAVPAKPWAPAWHRRPNDVYPAESKAYAEAMSAYRSAVERHRAAGAERSRRQSELDAEFRLDVLAAIGLAEHPKADLLYQMAYQRGHSGGYREVLSEAEDLAELLR